MGVFLLDGQTLNRIAEVKEYAENNQLLYNEWINEGCPVEPTKLQEQNHKILAEIKGLYSYKFVYTIEESIPKDGQIIKVRRLSACDLINRIPPPPEIMKMVMHLLGFKNGLVDCIKEENVYYHPGSRSIINVIERYE